MARSDAFALAEYRIVSSRVSLWPLEIILGFATGGSLATETGIVLLMVSAEMAGIVAISSALIEIAVIRFILMVLFLPMTACFGFLRSSCDEMLSLLRRSGQVRLERLERIL